MGEVAMTASMPSAGDYCQFDSSQRKDAKLQWRKALKCFFIVETGFFAPLR
jgi:hypothetical protein